jgi:uncharacterized protein YjbI with pentapeptide repeats
MLIICEPRFHDLAEANEDSFLLLIELDNQSDLRTEIVTILSDLFPDKVGDIESVGDSIYGISIFDMDDIDQELQIFTEYNAQKHNFEVRHEGKTFNTTLTLFTFIIDRPEPMPKNVKLTAEQVKFLQDSIHTDLTGLHNLNNLMLPNGDLSAVNFSGSVINNSIFSDTFFIASQFTDTVINNSDFNMTDMRYADFGVAALTNVDFTNADLRYVQFTGATLKNVTFTGADLRYADFAGASIKGKCIFTGATFVNLSAVLSNIDEAPPNIFKDAIDMEEEEAEEEYEGANYDDSEELPYLLEHKQIFSSADVKAGQIPKEDDDDDDDDDMFANTNPPLCADVINGTDINIQAYLERNDANFSVQLPNSDKYECVNLNDIKRFHIKSDKAGTKYFNYVYACNSDKPEFAFTEGDYIRARPYIRIGSFSLLVEKPDWFPQAEYPIYRKFKLVNAGTKPAFLSETMLRRGEQGDADYISSEWHCNAGKMETYKLEPIMEGGRKNKKVKRSRKTHKKSMRKISINKISMKKIKKKTRMHNKKKTQKNNLKKKRTRKL